MEVESISTGSYSYGDYMRLNSSSFVILLYLLLGISLQSQIEHNREFLKVIIVGVSIGRVFFRSVWVRNGDLDQY